MNLCLSLVMVLWGILSCTAQQTPKSKEITDTEIKAQGYQIKVTDSLFMKNNRLDIEKLERIGHTNNSTTPPYYQYETTIADDITLFISGDSESGYSKLVTRKGNPFEEGFRYYSSGNLKIIGTSYPDFFKKGIWYWYDDEGKIEKYENHDAPYTFTWEDVLVFLQEQNIKKEQVKNIYRGVADGIVAWEIVYIPEELYNTENAKVLTLDSKTGEILQTEIIDISQYLD